ncbi:phospholipase D zeta 1-like protein [Tanacetum coccineum]|uniref:phospholipase D n=1 Tax=Tanacetum coccineum TaxID=301880 RepID=A0ABQ5FEB6_9ASTR
MINCQQSVYNTLKPFMQIFMCGWWLCPDLYLRRPIHANASSRLDALLEAKAMQGVQERDHCKIYILVYEELALALKCNSFYSKKKLAALHENIRVLRYPDHFSSGVYFWSHREKLVIVDYEVCFIGGLDLCFGRYDSYEHKVGDHPATVWPGKDYYNPRKSEPNSWEDTMKDELNREKYPRMPWHDVHCALWGPSCRDIARHFVQRWNYAKRSKAPNEQTIPLLMPQQHMVIPHYMGSSKEQEDGKPKSSEVQLLINRQDSFTSLSAFQEIPLTLSGERFLEIHNGFELQRLRSRFSVWSFKIANIDYAPIPGYRLQVIHGVPVNSQLRQYTFVYSQHISLVLNFFFGIMEREKWATNEFVKRYDEITHEDFKSNKEYDFGSYDYEEEEIAFLVFIEDEISLKMNDKRFSRILEIHGFNIVEGQKAMPTISIEWSPISLVKDQAFTSIALDFKNVKKQEMM